MNITRRRFVAGGAAAFGVLCAPEILVAAARAAEGKIGGDCLVVLELNGGNDGLNTVIPFERDEYARARPLLGIQKDLVLRLDDGAAHGLGFHPRMEGLRALYAKGRVAVVPGVGYPNPNRSHFRSMDIWHTARPETERVEKGWLGLVMEEQSGTEALHIGDQALPLALASRHAVPSIQSLDFLDFLTKPEGKRMRGLMGALYERERHGDLAIVRDRARAAFAQLERLVALRGAKVPVEYPATALGERLRLAGQLIAADHACRIYYVSQAGYDTHARQADVHGQLLGELSDALAAFFQHLEGGDRARSVTVLVFSEFGRRVAENGSLGTDHGAAGPVLVLSGRVRGGVHGEQPSLVDLDGGDLRYAVDFRRVYATVLEDVLGIDPGCVLAGNFPKLPLFA